MLPDVNENGVFYGRGTGKARVSFRLRVCPAERPHAGQRCSPRYGFDSVSVSMGLQFVKWCGQWSQPQSARSLVVCDRGRNHLPSLPFDV